MLNHEIKKKGRKYVVFASNNTIQEMQMIPLFKPYMPETPNIDEILHSGALAYGDYTKEFELRLKDYFGTPYLVVTDSFENAIFITLKTLEIGFGDEVIASPMACLVSTQPYQSMGIKVLWADIDPGRGTLDPESVETKITSKTKAIIHNHFCGYPGYIDEINQIGKKYEIPIIDDGIESLGAEYKGMKIGNCHTDVTIFSLSAVRFCNCIEGGIIIFQEKKDYEKALLIRDCGIDRTRFRDELGEIDPMCDIKLDGFSATMSNINGYIGLKQIEKLDEVLAKHRKQASKWKEYIQNHTLYRTINCEEGKPNYWVYGVLVSNKGDAICEFRNKGFYASGVHIRNDRYSVFGTTSCELPGVDEFSNSFVALPCGWWMEE